MLAFLTSVWKLQKTRLQNQRVFYCFIKNSDSYLE